MVFDRAAYAAFVMFGGANPKNTQVAKGGRAWHGTSGALAALAQAGVRVVRSARSATTGRRRSGRNGFRSGPIPIPR